MRLETITTLTVLCGLAATGTTLRAQDTQFGKLSVHGYLTQAYAKGDGAQYFGINEDGTADYRKAALMFRYEVTPNDAMVVQLAHERFGASDLTALHDDVELDWAFYQHEFSNGAWARVGKVKIPMGIFNEIRDVGVLLPFYRLPYTFYGEGTYSTETVSGFATGREWSQNDTTFEATVYFGESDYVQTDLSRARLRNFAGTQLWLQPCAANVRFGAGYWHTNASDITPADDPRGEATWWQWHLSFDGQWQRVRLAAEYIYQDYGGAGDYPGGYALVSYKLNGKLSVHFRQEYADYNFIDLADELQTVNAYPGVDQDSALGFTYAFRPDLVGRIEAHRYRGFTVEPEWPDSEQKNDHLIVSLSASF